MEARRVKCIDDFLNDENLIDWKSTLNHYLSKAEAFFLVSVQL